MRSLLQLPSSPQVLCVCGSMWSWLYVAWYVVWYLCPISGCKLLNWSSHCWKEVILTRFYQMDASACSKSMQSPLQPETPRCCVWLDNVIGNRSSPMQWRPRATTTSPSWKSRRATCRSSSSCAFCMCCTQFGKRARVGRCFLYREILRCDIHGSLLPQ